MDIQALKRAKENLDSKTGSDGFLNQKNITGETVVRLLPPSPQLNGMFHLDVIKFWIAGKSYICRSTFGKKSVMQEELDEAKTSDDEDLVALATNTDNKTGVSKKTEFWMTLLQLEYKLNKKEEIVGYTVVDDKAKIMQCGSTLLSSMIKVATSRKVITAAAGSEDGIADRESGTNMVLSKTGQKLNTKYDAAIDESMEMDAKYYVDIPDVYAVAQAQMKTAKYQRAVMRQYLYGEDIPAAVQAEEDARMAAVKEEYKSKQSAVKRKVSDDDDEQPAPKKKAKAVSDDDDDAPVAKKKVAVDKKKVLTADDDDDDEPAPVKKKKKVIEEEDEDDEPVAKKKKKPAIEEDEDDEPAPVKKAVAKKKPAVDEDDDDDAPPVKKAVAKKKPAVDDDDEDEPAPVKKAVAKKKAVADDDDEDDAPPVKKKTAVKKTILDDIDEDLEED